MARFGEWQKWLVKIIIANLEKIREARHDQFKRIDIRFFNSKGYISWEVFGIEIDALIGCFMDPNPDVQRARITETMCELHRCVYTDVTPMDFCVSCLGKP